MEHITELRHLHPVKVYRYPIQPPCIGCRPISAGIRHRGHDSKLCPLDLINDRQIIKYNPILRLIILNYGYNAICLSVLKMPLSLKTSLWKNSPIKLFSMLGTRIIFYLKEEQIRSMLMVLLPLTAILVIFMKNAWNYTDTRKSLTVPVALKALLIGMTLGLYDSMYGPGGGTIAMLLFTFLLKYDIRTASGNAKLTLIVSNYTALLSYILSGNVFYMIAIPCAVSNVLGNYIGAGFAIKNGAKIIRPVMICVVTVLIVKIVLGK